MRSAVPVLIGTSGWHYPHWRPRFYPAGLGPARWLPFYAERFAAVEVNNAFYRLPERSTFERWGDLVPTDFVVAVKASRYLTHVKRLRDPVEPVTRLMDRVQALGTHLGPVLLQLPPTLRVDCDLLDTALAAFDASARLAVEPRHASWFVDEVREVLERRGAALCLASGGAVEPPLWRTTDWTYVRFHRGTGRPPSCYKRRELEAWIDPIAAQWPDSEDVYCFFNNDDNGCALRDARWLAQFYERAGRRVSRVPTASDIRRR
jgi:uncharacterized protein YecE (DUF72 family)